VSHTPAVLALAALLGMTSCSSSSAGLETGCTGGSSASIRLSVVNDTNETERICNATVTVDGGGTSVSLAPSGGQGECTYVGNVPKGGTYSVTVMVPDYPTTMSSVVVQAGCSVTPTVEIMQL
jgi:hypothetical protein